VGIRAEGLTGCQTPKIHRSQTQDNGRARKSAIADCRTPSPAVGSESAFADTNRGACVTPPNPTRRYSLAPVGQQGRQRNRTALRRMRSGVRATVRPAQSVLCSGYVSVRERKHEGRPGLDRAKRREPRVFGLRPPVEDPAFSTMARSLREKIAHGLIGLASLPLPLGRSSGSAATAWAEKSCCLASCPLSSHQSHSPTGWPSANSPVADFRPLR